MGTSWDVEVIDRGDTWVDLHLRLFSPDAGPFPVNANFALQLLTCEAYTTNEQDEFVGMCELGQAIEHDVSILPDDLEPVVADYIQGVQVYFADNLPWSEDTGDGERAMPSAKYRISVTEQRWIEHLTIGQTFSSAAFWEEWETDWGEFAIVNNRDHQEWICTNRDIDIVAKTLATPHQEKTSILSVVEREEPLSGAYTGDRSVRSIRVVDGKVLAACPSALEVHSVDLATGHIESRVASDAECEGGDDEFDLDALADGIIRRVELPDIVLDESPYLSGAVSLPSGFLVQVDFVEYLYVSESGECSKTDILPEGGVPVLYGTHVLIPYESSQGSGWLLWDAETQTVITSHIRKTGPSCSAVWHGKEGRVTAWSSPSADDPGVADKVWLEFTPA